jgi:threonine dehydratase
VTIEYASSAPLPASSSKHAQDGTEDEAVPDHLYAKLPRHYLESSPRGDVPDYLRMILMCTSSPRSQT